MRRGEGRCDEGEEVRRGSGEWLPPGGEGTCRALPNHDPQLSRRSGVQSKWATGAA